MSNSILHTEQIINSAIDAAKPANLISRSLAKKNSQLRIGNYNFDLAEFRNIYVVGTGKASAFMAKEIEALLGNSITSGFVSTNIEGIEKCKRVKIIEASHPAPNINSLLAGKEILDIALNANEDDLVICLISGGGSSLMESLPDSISLEDYRELTNTLIKCGAEINEINCVRSSLSLIKGGKLAEAVYPATCISLIISDVIGDRLETIASGSTYFNFQNKLNPKEIIAKYNLLSLIPQSIVDFLNRNFEQKEIDFEKISAKTFNIILGNNLTALQAAKQKAEELGYTSIIKNGELCGEASDAGIQLAQFVKSKRKQTEKLCLLFGGETTVTVRGKGLGGRNQELVLSALIDLENVKNNFVLASCGTDGKDGPTDAAGALIDETTWQKVKELNLSPKKFLVNNDSYNFFKQIDSLIKTGPTKTNVMDIQVILLP